jgi:hypothetical protein
MVTIVIRQNKMKTFTNVCNYFTSDAIVGNVSSVLLVVILVVIKPAGAIVV